MGIGPDSTHTTNRQNGRQPSCNTSKSPVWGWWWGRNATRKRSRPLFGQHCLVIRHVFVLSFVFAWNVPKWMKMRNWNTQAKTQRRNAGTDSILLGTTISYFSFFRFDSIMFFLYSRHCPPNRNHPLRISLSVSALVCWCCCGTLTSIQKSFLVFTGRIFQNFVV